jgi:type IV pilus assembly protein PilB
MALDRTPLIVSIDDDRDLLNLVKRILGSAGYRVVAHDDGREGIKAVREFKPNLVLLDIKMKGMDGYEICSHLQKDRSTAYIPVIFVTALDAEHNKSRALALGGVDYLVKPFKKEVLLQKVRRHLKTGELWRSIHDQKISWYERIQPGHFLKFKEYLFARLKLTNVEKYSLSDAPATKLYTMASAAGVHGGAVAQCIADFLNLDYTDSIKPEDVVLGVLPTPFCRSNHVLITRGDSEKNSFILSNPFNWDCMEHLKRFAGLKENSKIVVAEPGVIESLLQVQASRLGKEVPEDPREEYQIEEMESQVAETPVVETAATLPEAEVKKNPIIYIANAILNKAAEENASDIHILPKETHTEIRFRVDGDLREFYRLKKSTGTKLVSRFKVLGDVDIAERRKPQDGGFKAVIDDKTYNFRISTSFTPSGESLIIRLLQPYAKPKDLTELGMSGRQADTMLALAGRNEGLILVVGPTGSGKTTTIYSLLHNIDCVKRSLLSVEDPVEYRIPFANQQQVNERTGVTFESLLRSAVRQDPDVLFMGEVRDAYTAKMALDFASTGHLTITTMHTSNATTAVFRLERLGIDRRAMADTILAVVAQRLLKKLCPHCRRVEPISEKEREIFSTFTDRVPSEVAHPVGCNECHHTGYRGREGVYEVLTFDAEISEMVRVGSSIMEIRSFAQRRGEFLKSNHAVEKVRKFIFAPKDVYENVFAEEVKLEKPPSQSAPGKPIAPQPSSPSVLVADDNEDTRKLIGRILEKNGYRVTLKADGVDALLDLGKDKYDLVLSDINMPNLDGFHLLEIMNQKGIQTPVIFLTARNAVEDEKKGLVLGAMDYIKKPVQREILLLRVKSVIQRTRSDC